MGLGPANSPQLAVVDPAGLLAALPGGFWPVIQPCQGLLDMTVWDNRGARGDARPRLGALSSGARPNSVATGADLDAQSPVLGA